MPTTPIGGLRYPALSDNPNGPLAVQNLAEDVADQLPGLRYANSGTRDAAITSPDDGMTVWLDTPGAYFDRIDGAWVQRLQAATPIAFPTFPGTGGVHFAAIGGSYRPPKLFLSADGWVTGSSGVVDGAGGASRILTIFPAGYRPLNGTEPLEVSGQVSGTGALLRVDVATTGVATVQGTIPANTYAFLSSLRFNIDN